MAVHFERPAKCNSKLIKDSKYRKTCGGFPDKNKPWRNEIHHILCERAILDINPDNDSDGKKRQYIDDCLCISEYDLNAKVNLVGLPLKPAYIKSRGKIPVNLPCHNVDHPPYTEEVKSWLHKNIWNTLIDRRKKHDTTAKAIVEQLNNCTTMFTKVLNKRGGQRGVRPLGTEPSWTEASWTGRFDPANADTWYKPFSMAANPSKRSPGGRWRLALFEMIK